MGTAVTSLPARTFEAYVTFVPSVQGAFPPVGIFANTAANLKGNAQVDGTVGNDATVYTNGNLSTSSNSVFYEKSVRAGFDHAWEQQRGQAGPVGRRRGQHDRWLRGPWERDVLDVVDIDPQLRPCLRRRQGRQRDHRGRRRADRRHPDQERDFGPPDPEFPSFTFVSADWTAAGYTIRSTYSNCSTAVSDINNWFGAASGSYVVRVTPACAMTFTDNTTYTVKGNLAVITDGGITFGTNAKLVPAAGTGPWNVYLFAGMANTAPCDLTTSTNSGVASGLNALFFANTNCAVTMNSNVSLAAGQIFAGTVNWNNNVSFGYKQVPVPGGAANAASQDVKCIREVVTGPPPTTAPNC